MAMTHDQRSWSGADIEALEGRALLSVQPTGPEFRVSTRVSGNESAPVAAMDTAGNFVVAWQSYAQDGLWNGVYPSWGIFAQRYNNAAIAQGTEFRVNTFTTNEQQLPSIALDANGDFVVVWESLSQDGSG